VPPEPFDAPVPVEAAPVFVVVSALLESSPEACWPDPDAVFGALAVPWPSLQAVSRLRAATAPSADITRRAVRKVAMSVCSLKLTARDERVNGAMCPVIPV
jgi:hypothetical protein